MLKFTKMQGLGNDFMVIDAIEHPITLHAHDIARWSDRHTGVGFDQLLLIEKDEQDDVLFSYKIYNSNGSPAEQCGNGARCIARYLLDQQYVTTTSFTLRAPNSKVYATEQADGQISIDMGEPIFDPSAIPFITTQASESGLYSLQLANHTVSLYVLSMGNPHAVMFVPDIESAPLTTLGVDIAQHPAFTQGVNVEFVQLLNKNEVHVRVLERGSGETQACGSGACAAMVAARLAQLVDEKVSIHLPGGQLSVKWQGHGHRVIMTGPAVTVYYGEML